MTTLAYVMWFLVVVVTGFIVYGFVIVALDKVHRQCDLFRNRPLPPQRSNVRVITQRETQR